MVNGESLKVTATKGLVNLAVPTVVYCEAEESFLSTKYVIVLDGLNPFGGYQDNVTFVIPGWLDNSKT